MTKNRKNKYENSILIEGDYNFNYLTNLLFLSRTCILNIFEKKGLDAKKDKKIYKNVRNLCDFLNSSIEVFSRLSLQIKEEKCIIHNVQYEDGKTFSVPNLEDVDLSKGSVPTVEELHKTFCDNIVCSIPLTEKLSDDVIKKNKEVDDKYNEEE